MSSQNVGGASVLSPRSDPGDHPSVDPVGFGLGTATAPDLGGQLGWNLPDVQTSGHSGDRGWAAERAGPLDRYPGGGGVSPIYELAVTGRGVGNAPVFQSRAQVVHQTGRKGILVRVDPDNEHGSILQFRGFAGAAEGSAKRIHASKQHPHRGQIQVTLLSSDNTERATGGEALTTKATTPHRGKGQVHLEPSPPALPHPPFKHAWFSLDSETAGQGLQPIRLPGVGSVGQVVFR